MSFSMPQTIQITPGIAEMEETPKRHANYGSYYKRRANNGLHFKISRVERRRPWDLEASERCFDW
jgi:hypothetical protein